MDELKILQGMELTTHDIAQMGDSFARFSSKMVKDLNMSPISDDVIITPATIGIIAEVFNIGSFSSQGVQYVLNFDALPDDIKRKYQSGEYVLGESKQVEGDLRATLTDVNTKTRVKDVTVKRVEVKPDMIGSVRSILTQIQMKQISEKLDVIYDQQVFQIKRDRDRDLVQPFFCARDNIRDAQVTQSDDERVRYLNLAMEHLSNVLQAAYSDMRTSANMLAQHTQKPILTKLKSINQYMMYICMDIHMISLSMGFKLQIYDCLSKNEEMKYALKECIQNLKEFAQTPIGKNGETAIGLLQDNWPYSRSTVNIWYDFYLNITKIDESILSVDGSQVVMIGLED
ncbi:hypothetical protein SAMN02910456_02590 [Ruminococcaceae bacterium YRB3002]|nr:hypothetical protein SAMN02910456_02590 [Ruminococcaceae bacterium YRB3002]